MGIVELKSVSIGLNSHRDGKLEEQRTPHGHLDPGADD